MSKGKIYKPLNQQLPGNLQDLPMKDLIYIVTQSCEVDVDNTEWQDSDKVLDDKIKKAIEKISEIEKRLGNNHGNLSDQIKILKGQIEDFKQRKPLDLIVTTDKTKKTDLGKQHIQLPTLLQIVAAKLNVFLVGPAGAGKTTAAMQCAKALGVEFHFTGAVASEYKLTGFIDAQGRIVSTEFRKAYEDGGLFLFDEIDASYPQAVLAFNAALANDYMDFPDKKVNRHENFYCIAAANTYGQGADRQYVGRNQLDAASLDRFVFLDWKYDENLERDLAGNHEWSDYVQKIRRYVESQKIRHVVSPRASIFGSKLLANGINRETVENTVIWKGMDEATKQKVILNIQPKEIFNAKVKGRFNPNIKVGDTIKDGDMIGSIEYREGYNHYNHKSLEIRSNKNGTILTILDTKEIEIGEMVAEIAIS